LSEDVQLGNSRVFLNLTLQKDGPGAPGGQSGTVQWIHRILCIRWLPLPLDFPMFLLLHHLQDCGHLIPLTNIYLFILHELGTCTTSFFYLLYAMKIAFSPRY